MQRLSIPASADPDASQHCRGFFYPVRLAVIWGVKQLYCSRMFFTVCEIVWCFIVSGFTLSRVSSSRDTGSGQFHRFAFVLPRLVYTGAGKVFTFQCHAYSHIVVCVCAASRPLAHSRGMSVVAWLPRTAGTQRLLERRSTNRRPPPVIRTKRQLSSSSTIRVPLSFLSKCCSFKREFTVTRMGRRMHTRWQVMILRMCCGKGTVVTSCCRRLRVYPPHPITYSVFLCRLSTSLGSRCVNIHKTNRKRFNQNNRQTISRTQIVYEASDNVKRARANITDGAGARKHKTYCELHSKHHRCIYGGVSNGYIAKVETVI